MTTTTEYHSIKPFRGEEDLGIIRLNHLAYPSNMKITIAGREFKPRGFDTYGHPVIGRGVYEYYKSLKKLAEREGESLTAKVEYSIRPFCIKKELYDSFEGIKKVADVCDAKDATEERDQVEEFKKMLTRRKQAAFYAPEQELNTFVLYDKYVLAPNGHVYWLDSIKYQNSTNSSFTVVSLKKIEKISFHKEVHLPGPKDTCAICGAPFTMEEIEKGSVNEDEKFRKVHKQCYLDSTKAKEYATASEIIDAVYDGKPASEVSVDGGNRKYLFKTYEGTISISFVLKGENQIFLIEWREDFRPFDMSIIEPKFKGKDRCVEVWNKHDAIQVLMLIKA